MAKVAIASSDGITINEHFGGAKEFLIYEVFENGEYNLIEKRKVTYEIDNSIDHSIALSLAKLLSDVETVLSAQIGKRAEDILLSSGIKSFALKSTIEKALQSYGKNRKLIKNLSANCSGCSSGECGSGCT